MGVALRRGAALAAPVAALALPAAAFGGVAVCGTSKEPATPAAPEVPAYSGPAGQPMYEAAYKAIASLLDDIDDNSPHLRAPLSLQ